MSALFARLAQSRLPLLPLLLVFGLLALAAPTMLPPIWECIAPCGKALVRFLSDGSIFPPTASLFGGLAHPNLGWHLRLFWNGRLLCAGALLARLRTAG